VPVYNSEPNIKGLIKDLPDLYVSKVSELLFVFSAVFGSPTFSFDFSMLDALFEESLCFNFDASEAGIPFEIAICSA